MAVAGTGNPGALNTATTLGKKWGLAVLGADIAKGVVAARAGRAMAGPAGANVAASAAVIGHCFPATRGFRGGKGVATSVGQVLATFPIYLPIDAAVGATAVAMPFWKQRTMAANTIASAVWVGSATLAWRRPRLITWGPEPSAALPLAAALSSAAILKRFLDERDRAPLSTGDSGSTGTWPSAEASR